MPFEMLEEHAGKGEAPRVVVFVDDLDRCFPGKAVELLEHIKLVLHQPGFAFVLGVNDRLIQAVVETKFKNEFQLDPKCCEDYLDKIVQVKVPVPARKPEEMEKYVGHLIDTGKVFDDASIARKYLIWAVAEAGKCNPRSIVRLLNRIIVTSRIGAAAKKDYDPLALLIHLATDEPRFEKFRKALDITIILRVEGKPDATITIGELLSDRLKKYSGAHGDLITQLSTIEVPGMQGHLKTVVETLDENPHLCSLLSSEKGRKWLGDKVLRMRMGEASEITVTERQPETKVEEPPRTDLERVIRELQAGLVDIPAGRFMMGSDLAEDEKPVHEVHLKAFKISATPVTQAQYEAVMGRNPSHFKGPQRPDAADRPVECVSWNDAMEFCKRLTELTKKEGVEFTLPTEAQWEYAGRAGSNGKYCFVDNEKELDKYAWHSGNSGGQTHPVGTKAPNKLGLYDMHGNVWEWCLDWYGTYKEGSQESPKGPDNGQFRVLRGGSWNSGSGSCRSALRYYLAPALSFYNLGLRLVAVARTQNV